MHPLAQEKDIRFEVVQIPLSTENRYILSR